MHFKKVANREFSRDVAGMFRTRCDSDTIKVSIEVRRGIENPDWHARVSCHAARVDAAMGERMPVMNELDVGCGRPFFGCGHANPGLRPR